MGKNHPDAPCASRIDSHVGEIDLSQPETHDIPTDIVEDLTTSEVESSAEEAVPEEDDWRKAVHLTHLKSKKMREKVIEIQERHHPVFQGKLGQIKATQHRIDLKLGTKPVRQ